MMDRTIPIVIYILAAAIANFLARALPYYVTFLDRLPPFVAKSLRLLPVAALGALVFPSVITDFSPRWYAGLAGISVSFLYAYHRRGMIGPILLSIVATYLALVLPA
jgi:branched-subunit amino acid transport protein